MDTLRARDGAEHVVEAVVRVGSTRTTPGVIENGSPFVEIDLAGRQERTVPLAAQLAGAGVTTRVLPDENAVLLGKLAFLAPSPAHHPPSAAHRQRRGRAAGRADGPLVQETVAVSRACGGQVEAAEALKRYYAFPADSRSSMQRDAEAGRPLEPDSIGGALLRAAEWHGIRVPLTTHLLSAREADAEPLAHVIPDARAPATDQGAGAVRAETCLGSHRPAFGSNHRPRNAAVVATNCSASSSQG
ncbi:MULTISPECIES: ketopantoate reductase family protein [unclassified Streptomyces]|uniref:ketopantoate reductase family protein n=1 Tax=unclassified Streptomyces TaxID=2593676 RepID=UPI0020356F6F|nr:MULTISPECIES: ketopantoate reductase C-terminal domain-containing protein [unclassified Streptomyces]